MGIFIGLIVVSIIIFTFYKMIYIVPEQEAFIIEHFGDYKTTLTSGIHVIIPFIQRVAYRHSLKEEVIDVPIQFCIAKDNVQVEVDGILYIKVINPVKASYGIDNYRFATSQLTQTIMRSEIGKIELDKCFAERNKLNLSIVRAVDEAAESWGIKVTRYEIKEIKPSDTVFAAMEKQVRAERNKRAEILKSEGEKLSRINLAEGQKISIINLSKATKIKTVNESIGKAKALEIISSATADGLKKIAFAIRQPKGKKAVSYRIAEQFIDEFGNIIAKANTSVIPTDIANFKGFLKSVVNGVNLHKSLKSSTDK